MTKKIIFKNAQKTFHAEVDYETKSNKKTFVSTKPSDGFRYEGFIKDGKASGAGKLFDRGIRFYEGNWKNGYFNGNGCLYDFRGIFPKYEASFKEGKLNGSVIIYNLQHEKIFEGTYKNNIRKYGTTFINGRRLYTGSFNNKKEYHGKGTEFDEDDTIIYTGNYKNGKYCGLGTEYYEGTGKYIGHFKDNKKEGKGSYYNNDMKIFEGTYKNDKKKNGKLYIIHRNRPFLKFEGEFTDGKKKKGDFYEIRNGMSCLVYHGSFEKGYFSGKGTFYPADGYYNEGTFKKDLLEGSGKIYYPNGKVLYKGKFHKNKKEGKGTQYFENGKVSYTGTFKNNLYHGYGTDYTNSGSILYEGYFKEHREHGKGIYHAENGSTLHVAKSVNGVIQGRVKEYTPEKVLHAVWTYVNGDAKGPFTFYYPNGKVKFRGEWKDHAKNGFGREYNEEGKLIRKGIWRNDHFEDPHGEKQKKARENQNKIKYFMQTNQKSYLKKVKSTDIIAYLKKTANKKVKGNKAKLITQLEKWRKQLKQAPTAPTQLDSIYNVYLMQHVPMDDFLKEDDAIVLINEQGKRFGHFLPQHEIMYECENDRSWRSYVNNPNVKAMIRMTTEGGNYYFLRTDSIIDDMKKGYNVFHFKTHAKNVRILSKNVALGGSIMSAAHCDPKDIVKISETTKKEKRGDGLKMTVNIEF